MATESRQSDAALEVRGPGINRRIEVGDDPVTVGRHVQNAVVLNDHQSSRFHCLIGRGEGSFYVRDLNSSNGTLLNGRRVATSTMSHGDEVRIGHTRITLQLKGQPPTVPVRAELLTKATTSSQHARVRVNAEKPQEVSAAIEDPGLDPIPLSELEDVETLTADDLAEPLDSSDIVAEIPLADDFDASGSSHEFNSFDQDPETVLRHLADALPNKHFGERDIALVGARGQVIHQSGKGASSNESVEIFRLLLLVCARGRATDIHLEPKNEGYVLRTRVDGSMVDLTRLSRELGIRTCALVKVLSEIDLSQKNSIQEGHFSSRVPGVTAGSGGPRRVDYRVSFAPSVFGQKLVMRILDTTYAPLHIGALGLPEWMKQSVERATKQESGMILVCGPTGSGKTTTLYALLRGAGVQKRNVVTIEDPVEIQLPSVTQIPVDEEKGNTFSSLLRSVLRQDPDVILIGEIRDGETARIAMQAAITGHLVFSTVHTRDTIGTVFRLLDLGVEPYLVAQALNLVLSQRLARTLCPSCKVPVTPTVQQLERLGQAGQNVKKIYRPTGCKRCMGTGFSGRQAFFELLQASDELRDLIARTPTLGQIKDALASTPFQRLQESGFQLVAQGVADFDEIERAMGRDAQSDFAK